MDPSSLIPSSDIISVHWGWFQFFLILTFILHLLFMNTMLGIGIIALVSSVKSKLQDLQTAKEISGKLPYTIAFTVNTGVAPLLFIQVLYGNFIYTSSVLMAVYWLSIFVILLIAYYSAYIYSFKFDTLDSGRTFFIALTVIFMLVIGFFFSNNMTLMLTPDRWTRYFTNPDGTILNFSEPTLFPRFFHFVAASIAVGGLFLALVFKFKKKNSDYRREKIAAGMRWFNYSTIAQILIGVWFLISLPGDIIFLFFGGNSFATILFFSGIIGTTLALVFGFQEKVWPCTITTLFTIIIMVLIRDLVRRAYLEPYFTISTLKVVPQYSPLILFVVTLVIGLSLVGYMLKLALQNRREDEK